MTAGSYGRLQSVSTAATGTSSTAWTKRDIIPELTFTMTNGLMSSLQFDPSTFLRISRTPLERDAYESATVCVAQSAISPLAGEGLFAKRRLGTAAGPTINPQHVWSLSHI